MPDALWGLVYLSLKPYQTNKDLELSLLIVNDCAICPFRLCGPEFADREGKTAQGTF